MPARCRSGWCSGWLNRVLRWAAGERLAEVVVGGVLFHVESQTSGTVGALLVERDAVLQAGQALCVIDPDSGDDE